MKKWTPRLKRTIGDYFMGVSKIDNMKDPGSAASRLVNGYKASKTQKAYLKSRGVK